MAKPKPFAGKPEFQTFTIDINAIKESMVRRANDAVPAHIKAMNPAQCMAEIRRILKAPGPVFGGRAREPGDDDE